MKIRNLLVVSVSLCIFPTSAFASGILIDTKGKVNITMPDGKNAAAKTGVELPDGTKISVGSGASASIMFMDGSIQEIGAGQKYTIGSGERPAGKRTVIEGIALAMNEMAAAGSGPTLHGMVKISQPGVKPSKPSLAGIGGGMGLEGIFPVETAIAMAPQITFVWRGPTPRNPVIVFDDASKKRIAFKKIAPAKSRIAVKTNELKLAQGNAYSWYLASNENGKILGKSRRFNFSILSAADKKRLRDDKAKIQTLEISEDGKRFLIAQLYYRSKMVDAMVKELVPVWERNRSDAVKKLLFWGYARMGQAEEAKKYQ